VFTFKIESFERGKLGVEKLVVGHELRNGNGSDVEKLETRDKDEKSYDKVTLKLTNHFSTR